MAFVTSLFLHLNIQIIFVFVFIAKRFRRFPSIWNFETSLSLKGLQSLYFSLRKYKALEISFKKLLELLLEILKRIRF